MRRHLLRLDLFNYLHPQAAVSDDAARKIYVFQIEPCFFVAATGDHIVPWKTSYMSTALVGGPSEFILTDGGHVSGTVLNHPVRSRRTYYKGGDRNLDPESWRNSAETVQGSWWPHWLNWLDVQGGGAKVPAPTAPGGKAYPVLGPAPGTYVTEKVR